MTKYSRVSAAALAAAGIAIFSSSAALAEDGGGDFYLSASAGLHFNSDHDFTGTQDPDPGVPGTAGDPANISVDYDTGFALTGAIGYRFNTASTSVIRPRVELEFVYAEADVDTVNGEAGILNSRTKDYSIKAGIYGDFIWNEDQKIIPYLGGGAGIATVDPEIAFVGGLVPDTAFGLTDKRTAFGAHGSAGLTVKADDNFDIFAEGRYSYVASRSFDVHLRPIPLQGGLGLSARVRDSSSSFRLAIGARVNF